MSAVPLAPAALLVQQSPPMPKPAPAPADVKAAPLAPAALVVQQPPAVPESVPTPVAASYPTPSYYLAPVLAPKEVNLCDNTLCFACMRL